MRSIAKILLAAYLLVSTMYANAADAEGKLIPPSISAVFGMYTENDTWFAGGVHMGVWKNDNIRYTGMLATGSINIKLYKNILGKDFPVDVNIDPDVLYQGLKFRLNGSGFFAGVNYLLLGTNSEVALSAIDGVMIIQSRLSIGSRLMIKTANFLMKLVPGSS